MSGVTALVTSTGGNIDGVITLASTQPGLLSISNDATAPYTINIAPISANVNSLNGKIGSVTLTSPYQSFAPDPASGLITVAPYVPATGTATGATLTAPALGTALAWNTANAYVPGNVVISGGTTYVCLVAQPASSSAPTNGANWQSIGGGGGGGNWSYRGIFNTSVATAYALNDVVFDTVNTTETYVCIAGYTTSSPFSPPSANATNWLLFATNSTSGNGALNALSLQITGNPNLGDLVSEPETKTGIYCRKDNNGVVTGIGFGTGQYPPPVGLTWTGDSENPALLGSVTSFATPGGTTVSQPFTMYCGLWSGGNSYCRGSIVLSPTSLNTYVLSQDFIPGSQDPPNQDPAGDIRWTLFALRNVTVGGIMTFRGEFNINTPGTSYNLNDVVYDPGNNNLYWICISPYVTTSPVLDPGYLPDKWRLFSNSETPHTTSADSLVSVEPAIYPQPSTGQNTPADGLALYWTGDWSQTQVYTTGAIVRDTTTAGGNKLYLKIGYLGATPAPLPPHEDTTNWYPFA